MPLNTSSAHTDEEKAELFNQFFFSVYSNQATSSVTNSLPTLDDIDFDVSEVFRILASLDTSKAMGIDGIGPLVLKSCADVLCVPIHHLFTVSLSNGYLPSEWCIHLITPIFKSGDKSSIRNYRPISLLCSVSKVLERIIFSSVSDFVADSISTSQFGFMRGRSSQQQLLVMLNEIFSNKNSKTCSDIVYLDISKAFDSVSHDVLLLKLQLMGISGTILNWFKAYLDNRRQLVSVNGSFSGFLPVTSGVPQGSILGPLLFLIYINDLPDSVLFSKPLLFADDTKCLISSTKDVSSHNMQQDLDSLYQWSISNYMNFNQSKCAALIST